MKLPIMYAFEYPKRFYSGANFLDLAKRGTLNFFEPDYEKFPCLKLAFEAIKMGGNVPCALNAANEVAVDKFLKGQIKFTRITEIVTEVVDKMNKACEWHSLEDIINSDKEARAYASEI
jgi:1-deoxy-D-xylulose-5-phosphate reductoisomerase